jgi:TRAP-type mannitol/chloroaromatic compound transport system substrate-binding protein
MTMTKILATSVAVAALLGAGLAQAPTPASAEETVTLRLQSAYPRTLPMLGPAMHAVADKVEALTEGTLRIRVYEPNALVPMLQTWDAVAAGSVDAGFAGLGFWVGKEPAVSFFNSVPFGPEAAEYLAWHYEGGGSELMDEVLGEHNIKALNCNMISPEGSGWFREPIEQVEDLQGLRMRIVGLGGATLEKLGVSTQILAPGDIYPALERGVLDATEFSMPNMDLHFGYHEVAKHYYFPGWHQLVTINQLLINRDRWESLSERQRLALEAVCHDELLRGFALSEASQGPALRELEEEHGVTLHRWGPEFLEAFQNAWQEVVDDYAADDETFAKVYESFRDFREQYAIWRELGYL